ncbi:MAG: hypothetical protein ACK5NG_05190 [Chthoniobacterales bacterium]
MRLNTDYDENPHSTLLEGANKTFTYEGLDTHTFTIFSDNPNVAFSITPEPDTSLLLLFGIIFLTTKLRRVLPSTTAAKFFIQR